MTKYKVQKNMLFLSLLAIFVGFVIMIAVQTNLAVKVNEKQDTADLITYIEQIETETAALETEIAAARAQIEMIQAEQAVGQGELESYNATLARVNQYAGLTALEGQGMIVTLDDNEVGAELAQKNNPASFNAENYIVHDKDLLYLVRAMSKYSEAISINGIRLVDTTSIRCTGTVILVNSARLAPPYVISVIGDPISLSTALTNSSRYYRLTYMSIPIKYETSTKVSVPAYSGAYTTNYSTLARQTDTTTMLH